MQFVSASHTTRRRVPQWAWLAVLCAVLGLVTSVGVAWAVVYRYRSAENVIYTLHLGSWRVYKELQSSEHWAVTVYRTRTLSTNEFKPRVSGETQAPWIINSPVEFDAATHDAASRRAMARHLPLLASRDGQYVRFDVELSGWPFRCLAYERACDADRAKWFKAYSFRDSVGPTDAEIQATPLDPAFTLRPSYHALEVGNHLLPTFPLWPGLLANTAFYSVAWAVLIFTPLVVRRWLRARRGGCAGCGYSREGLKANAPCPECGRAVT